MIDKVQKWFRKRNWRRTFHLNLIAFDDAPLDTRIKELSKLYKLSVLKGAGSSNQSLEIRIRPKQLQEFEKKLPETVACSYEIKKPERH